MDKPRLLRASVHSLDFDGIRRSRDDEGVPQPMRDAEAVAQAAEESAYTDSPGAALKGEPEAVSREEQERQVRHSREKRERVVLSPLVAIDRELEKLEETGNYRNADLRFIRKKLGRLGEDALRRSS